jgi:hypothetical protein
MFRHVSYVLLALLTTSCTTPFDPPRVEAVDSTGNGAHFEGLRAQLRPGEPLDVLWIHGQCPHDSAWVARRRAAIETYLGVSATQEQGDTVEDVLIERWKFSTPSGDLRISFVIWSPLTESFRTRLHFDGTPPERASLNNDVKVNFMNACFVDPTVYAGPNGAHIRHAIKHVLCEALDGNFDLPTSSCNLTRTSPPRRLATVSESLGSKILFDGLRALMDSRDAVRQTRLVLGRLDRLRYVYMVSNQLPLLDLADHPNGGTSSIRTVLGALPDRAGHEPTVVNFSDPNDLLSYRLLPEVVGTNGRLINVIVSNRTTYFGYLENPVGAHAGYADNPWVIRYLIEGY